MVYWLSRLSHIQQASTLDYWYERKRGKPFFVQLPLSIQLLNEDNLSGVLYNFNSITTGDVWEPLGHFEKTDLQPPEAPQDTKQFWSTKTWRTKSQQNARLKTWSLITAFSNIVSCQMNLFIISIGRLANPCFSFGLFKSVIN